MATEKTTLDLPTAEDDKGIETSPTGQDFPIPSNVISPEKVDELITKIKYLKFTLLQEENELRFLNVRKDNVPIRRAPYTKTTLGVIAAERRGSLFEEKKTGSNEEVTTKAIEEPVLNGSPEKPKKSEFFDKNSKLKLKPSDCDLILKLILEKQEIQWYPELLGGVNQETAAFIKQHFTDQGSELYDLDEPYSPKITYESKIFDFSPWTSYLEGNVFNWNFDMLKFRDLTNGKHVLEFGVAAFKKFKVNKALHIDPTTLTNFLNDVSDSYLNNPYHNSIHGADVVNSVGYFLLQEDFGKNFSEFEKSCLIISALVHDLGHPGVNNAFLIATKSREALIYNDQSVLENFHVASFFKILQKSESNILKNLHEKDYKLFRKLSIHLILDTDLQKHFMIVTKFKNMSDSLNMAEEADRHLCLSVCLKCADVAHGAKELSLHKKWSRRILEEFFFQGDKEREHGLPVTPMCNRAEKIAKSQQGFLNFIVTPLFDAFDNRFFNEEMRKTITQQIKENTAYWAAEIEKEEKGESDFLKDTAKVMEEILQERGLKK